MAIERGGSEPQNLDYFLAATKQREINAAKSVRDELKYAFRPDREKLSRIDTGSIRQIDVLAEQLTDEEREDAQMYVEWLTGRAPLNPKSDIDAVAKQAAAIQLFLDRLTSPDIDNRFIAQLVWGMDQHRQAELEQRAEYLNRMGENQALTYEQIRVQSEASDRSAQRLLRAEAANEAVEKAAPARSQAERLRNIFVRQLIHGKDRVGTMLGVFWNSSLGGMEHGEYQTPLDHIFSGTQKVKQLAGKFQTALEPDDVTKHAAEAAPTGRELEAVLSAMEIPIRFALRESDGTLRYIDVELGPTQAADFYAGNYGRLDKFTYQNPNINKGRPFTAAWAKEQGLDLDDPAQWSIERGLNPDDIAFQAWTKDVRRDVDFTRFTSYKEWAKKTGIDVETYKTFEAWSASSPTFLHWARSRRPDIDLSEFALVKDANEHGVSVDAIHQWVRERRQMFENTEQTLFKQWFDKRLTDSGMTKEEWAESVGKKQDYESWSKKGEDELARHPTFDEWAKAHEINLTKGEDNTFLLYARKYLHDRLDHSKSQLEQLPLVKEMRQNKTLSDALDAWDRMPEDEARVRPIVEERQKKLEAAQAKVDEAIKKHDAEKNLDAKKIAEAELAEARRERAEASNELSDAQAELKEITNRPEAFRIAREKWEKDKRDLYAKDVDQALFDEWRDQPEHIEWANDERRRRTGTTVDLSKNYRTFADLLNSRRNDVKAHLLHLDAIPQEGIDYKVNHSHFLRRAVFGRWAADNHIPLGGNLDVEMNPNGQTLYTHPIIDNGAPFNADWFDRQSDDWKRTMGFVTADGNPMTFNQFTTNPDVRVELDDDPLESFKCLAPGEIHWTRPAMHRDGSQRGLWVNWMHEHIRKTYHLEHDWTKRLEWISGESVDFHPFDRAHFSDKEGTGTEVWNQAMGNYYASFLGIANDMLTITGYLRNFDPTLTRDEIPDPIIKIYKYMAYTRKYTINPEYARMMLMTDYEDQFGADIALFPTWNAIEGKSVEVRAARSIFFSDTPTKTAEKGPDGDGSKDKLPMLVPLKAKATPGKILVTRYVGPVENQKEVKLEISRGELLPDDKIMPSDSEDMRALTTEETRVLRDFFYPRRTSSLLVQDIMSTFRPERTPMNWTYANVVVHIVEEADRELKAHRDDPDYIMYERQLVSRVKRELDTLTYERQDKELADEYYDVWRPDRLYHVSSRQEIWARYQKLSPKQRAIIANIDFGPTNQSMGGEMPSGDARYGWRGLGEWINNPLTYSFKSFASGEGDKNPRKRGIKYPGSAYAQIQAKAQYITSSIQALPRTLNMNMGVQVPQQGSFRPDDIWTAVGVNAIELYFASQGIRDPRQAAKYLEDMTKNVIPASMKNQVDPETAQRFAYELVMMNYMIVDGYVTPIAEGRGMEKRGVGEKADNLTLNPESKLAALGREALLGAGYGVKMTADGRAFIVDRSGEAVIRQSVEVAFGEDPSELSYDINYGIARPFRYFNALDENAKVMTFAQLHYLKDAGLINDATFANAERFLEEYSAFRDNLRKQKGNDVEIASGRKITNSLKERMHRVLAEAPKRGGGGLGGLLRGRK